MSPVSCSVRQLRDFFSLAVRHLCQRNAPPSNPLTGRLSWQGVEYLEPRLLLDSDNGLSQGPVTPAASAYGGRLDNVSSNAPAYVGQPIDVTVDVTNTGTTPWYGSYGDPSWAIKFTDMSWLPPGTSQWFYEYTDLSAGHTTTTTVTVGATNLPSSPGSYSCDMYVYYLNSTDDYFYSMAGCPVDLPFTMHAAPPSSTATIGSANDIAYDASGNLHFAWFDYSVGNLKYAVQSATSGQWSTPVVVDQSSPEVGQYVSMDINSAGEPGLAYYDAWNADLKYAHLNGGGWDVQTVHAKNSSGMYPSLCYDASGRPVIAYYVPTGGYLFAAHLSGSQWAFDLLDGQHPFTGGPAGTEDVGRYPSLAMIPGTMRCAVAYENTSTGVFKYAEQETTGQWSSTIYDSDTQNGGGYVSLAFDSSNSPCISYYDAYPADLRYARRSAGKWTCQTVAAKNSQGLYTALWFNGADARIAYWYRNGDNLVLARQSGSTWSFATLVNGAGREAQVAVNPLRPLGGTDYLAATRYVGLTAELECGIVL